MLCVVSVAACSASFVCTVCVCCVQCVWDGGSGLGPVRAPRGSSFSPREVTDGLRGMWEMGHQTFYGADMREFGGTQWGYKAWGRLGNLVRVMGYPGKQCDTQRVRTLGRGLGTRPGDWWALGWEGSGDYGEPMGLVRHPRKGRRQRHPRGLWVFPASREL